MKRRVFTVASLATATLLIAQQATPQQANLPQISVEDYKVHLDIWMFELQLNRHKTIGAIIEVNPHTRRLIKENAHRFATETRAALAKDITLLLAIKENTPITEFAQRKGLKVYRNSFGKEEWPEWLNLLDEFAKDGRPPTSK